MLENDDILEKGTKGCVGTQLQRARPCWAYRDRNHLLFCCVSWLCVGAGGLTG